MMLLVKVNDVMVDMWIEMFRLTMHVKLMMMMMLQLMFMMLQLMLLNGWLVVHWLKQAVHVWSADPMLVIKLQMLLLRLLNGWLVVHWLKQASDSISSCVWLCQHG